MKKMKKLISVLLVAVMMVSIVPQNVYATEIETGEVTEDAVNAVVNEAEITADEKEVTEDVEEVTKDVTKEEAKAEVEEETKVPEKAKEEKLQKEEKTQKEEIEKQKKHSDTVRVAPGAVVESVEGNVVTLIKDVDGWYYEDYDEETDEYVEWFRYEYCPTFTATFSDGSVVESDTDGSLLYEGEWIWAEWDDDQSFDNQWDIGKHEATGSFMGCEFDFVVEVIENPVKSIAANDVSIIEKTNGYYDYDYNYETDDYDLKYYRYNYTPEYTVTLKDGTVLKSDDGEIRYNGRWISPDYYDDQSYETTWGLGTHEVTASILGKEFTFNVTIMESPVASVKVSDVELYENIDGWYSESYDDETDDYIEWFRYDYSPEFTVTLKDGTVLTSEDGYVEYKGKEHYVDYNDDQSYIAPWSVGEHEVSGSVMGQDVTFNVIVKKLQVESLLIEDVEIIENSNGDYDYDYNPETDDYDLEYFRYEYNPEYTVILDNGTELESDYYGDVYFNGDWHSLEFDDGQSYENQWGIGVHTVTASIFGYETEFNVTIVKNPVKSVVVNPVSLIENCDGWYDEDYNDETDEYELYYRYSYAPEYTVTLNNGTVLESDEDGEVYYNGKWHYLEYEDDQSANNPWGLGKHKVTASILGYETEFTVTITKSPVKTVVINPISVIENYDGWFDEDYNEETDEYDPSYFRYSYVPEYIVTLNDGTVLYSDEDGDIKYNDRWYSLECDDGQSYDNQWEVGNTYTVQANILGYDTEFQVSVEETPVSSISFENIQIVKNTNGYYEYGWDDDTEEEYEFYYYEIGDRFECTITMKDGTVLSNYGKPFVYYNNKKLYFDYSTDQYDEPWELGKYDVEVYWLGASANAQVEIIESPYVSIEVVRTEKLYENISGYRDEESGDFIYDIPAFSYKLTAKDGNCIYGIFEEYDDDIEISTNQYSEPWTVGGENLITVRYGNLTTEYSVEIIPSDEFEYMEQNDGIYITSYNGEESDVVIPSEIDGKPVVGILYFGSNDYIEKLTIPDSVVSIAEDAFDYMAMDTVIIGSRVNYLSQEMFTTCYSLETITVSKDNPYYCDVDGIVYDKNVKTLIIYPEGRLEYTDDYNVPDTVTNIDVLSNYPYVNVYFSENSSNFVTVDDVTYTSDMKKIVRVNPDISGTYEMPDTVTEIANAAFIECYDLEKVIISDKVTEIPEDAFYYCENLETVELPAGLKSIGDYAFCECYDLKNINLPAKLESIGQAAFECTAIEEITVPDSVTYLGNWAFGDCSWLNKVVIGSGITELEDCTFVSCYNLTDVEIKGSAVEIGNSVFEACSIESFDTEKITGSVGSSAFSYTDLTEVQLSEGVTDIAYGAFRGCDSLSKIDIPKSLISMNGHAFDETAWEESQEGREVYLEHVFYDYRNTDTLNDELKIKDGTTVIADYALEECSNLVKLVLPEGIKYIGYSAFAESNSLKEISIPASVIEIGMDAFAECASLEKITVAAGNKYYSSKDGVVFSKDGTELIWCPKQTSGTYEIPESVDYVHYGAFSNSGLKDIIIRNNDIILEEMSIGYNTYTNERYCLNMYCEENSNAYDYAMDNLQNYVDLSKLETEIKNPFVDIKESNYYYDAVLWAVDQGITNGKTATQFQPTESCDRGQVVTFLWRSQGCPEPKTTVNPFVDVKTSDYYYKAVLWAFENGITTGKDATHFQPKVAVPRNQFVTFLWRAEGKPAPTIKNPFVDVPNGQYYTDAVLWAYEKGITTGKDATHFQPTVVCQRCQVVTFLYRAYK